MNHLRPFARAGTVAMIIAGGAQSSVVAQPLEFVMPSQAPQAKATTKAPETRIIRVRNVRAGLMAWWLDPFNSEMPVEVMSAHEASRKSGGQIPESWMPEMQENIYADAKGLISFAPIAAQNTLMVYGTEEGIRRLEEIVVSLDKPVTQIEISTRFIAISPEDAAGLNIEFPATLENTRSKAHQSSKQQVGFARSDVQAQVDALIQQGKARQVNAPRTTTLNNLTALFASTMSVPAVLGIKDEAGELKAVFDSNRAEDALSLHIGSVQGLVVTPSVQKDDVISLKVGPYKKLHVIVDNMKNGIIGGGPGSFANPSATTTLLRNNPYSMKRFANPYAVNKREQNVNSISTYKSDSLFLKSLDEELRTIEVRNGQTLVFTGLDWATVPYNLKKQNAAEGQYQDMMILATINIVRRANAK